MLKKWIRTVMLAAVVLLCAAVLTKPANAASVGDLTYQISNGAVTITDCSDEAVGKLTIPATIGGYPVTAIGDYAFDYCRSLTEVVIPDSVIAVGNCAFEACSELTSATLGNGVTAVGHYMFRYCSKLSKVTLGSKVEVIGDYAFAGCEALQSIDLPKSLTTIRYYAFQYCSGLTAMNIPEGVTVISAGAFAGCSGLTSLSIPNTITYIGDQAFAGCSGVRCNVTDGMLYIGNAKNPYVVLVCPANDMLSSYTIHKDTKIIYGGAFAYAGQLKGISIPKGVRCIGDYAFHYCIALKDITIPGGMIYIGFESFKGCSALTKLTLPDSVTFIDSRAFQSCTALKQISLGNKLESIGQEAFYDCISLTDIRIPDSVTYMGPYAFSECGSLKTATLGSGITKIPDSLFSHCAALTGIVLPNGLTEIGTYAFYECTALAEVTIPYSVTKIGTSAFESCAALKKVAVLGRVTKLEMFTFRRCAALTDLQLPVSLAEISYEVFSDCTALRNVYYEGSTQQWSGIDQYGGNALPQGATLYTGCGAADILRQPADETVKSGSTAKFSISADGPVSSYQWQYRTASGSWKNVSGETKSIINISATAAKNGYRYRCVVTDSYGFTHYSDAATLNVLGIKTQPANKYVAAGKTAKFTVKAVGKGLKYQWQYRTSSKASWKNTTGTGNKTATLSVPATVSRNGNQYRCVITDAAGNKVYTKTVSLYALSIKTQPVGKTVKSGTTAKFTVSAIGGGLTYQWQYRTSAKADWKNTSATGCKTKTLSVSATAAKHGYQFRCVITDGAGNRIYTSAVTLNVLGIKTQPASKTVASGKTVTFKVAAVGKGLKYRWQYRTSSTGGWKNSAATGSKTSAMSIAATAAKNGYQFRCVITDAAGNKVYTSTATLNVVSIKTQPVSKTAASGKTVKFTVAAVGKGLKYQWQYRAPDGSWKNTSATGCKTNTLSVWTTAAKNGYQFRCKITNSAGVVIYTNAVRLTVKK